MKIFVIGFNKTASTSIHNLFLENNINSLHLGLNRPDTNTFLPHLENYDAFCDGYHGEVFKEYYNCYPDSLFILNIRPLREWLISRYKHAYTHNFEECWCWPPTFELTKEWINDRIQYHNDILNFFKDKPNNLFIVNIGKYNWQNELLKFIGKPTTDKIILKNRIGENIVGNKIDIINNIIDNKSLNIDNYNKLSFNDSSLHLKFKHYL